MTKFKFFTITDFEKEQEYLNEQHKKGWKLTHITFPGFYHFEQCASENVIYQLDYNPDRHKNFRQYIQMYEDCGWNYICDLAGYSYFFKSAEDMNQEEGIFNDDFSKKDMLERVFKGRMIPLFIIFGLVLLPNLIANIYFTYTYKQPYFIGVLFVFVCLFILYLTIFIKWIRMHKRLQKK